jgi:hypothetical protein
LTNSYEGQAGISAIANVYESKSGVDVCRNLVVAAKERDVGIIL